MPVTIDSKSATRKASKEARLRRFLQAYWLRPENALWMALRSEALDDCVWTGPSADISCGDGVFSFLNAGGSLDPAFDVFQSASTAHPSPRADMFDYVADHYRPPIIQSPDFRITTGTDHKPALLTKAARLGFYHETVESDNESPLPFADQQFQTIYCNSAYWVRDIDGFLGELRRICAPGGTVILQVKLRALFDYTLRGFRGLLGERFLDIIDRGRAGSWPTVADETQWEGRFERAAFSVIQKKPIASATHAHIWDVGLRPVAPMLVRMTAALTPQTRASIKNDWVDLMCDLLLPFFDPTLDLNANDRPPAEVQYHLKPA